MWWRGKKKIGKCFVSQHFVFDCFKQENLEKSVEIPLAIIICNSLPRKKPQQKFRKKGSRKQKKQRKIVIND